MRYVISPTPPEADPTYFVKNGGNDAADGLSDSTAWATVAKVNATTFSAGQSVGFRRGDTWREKIVPRQSGSAGNPVTYRAYGTGDKPKFLGSVSLPSGWSNSSGNIWQYSGFTLEVCAVHMDGATLHGVRKAGTGSLTTQGDFYYSGGTLYLYSVGDPGGFYSDIEAALDQTAMHCGTRSYLTVTGLDLRYWGHGGLTSYPTNGLIFEYNDISWVGAGPAAQPMGNGIGGQAASNSIVRYNRIHQCIDAGMSRINYSTDGALHDTELYGNVVSNCEYGYEQQSYDTGNYSGVSIHDNVFFGMGYTIWHDYRDAGDKYGNGLQSWSHTSGTVTPSGCSFDDNLVYGSRLCHIRIPAVGWTADGNRCYADGAAMFAKYGVSTYNFAGWQAAGYDATGSLLDEISGTDAEIIAALEAML